MAFTDKQVKEELKKHGVTTLDDLARKISEQSAAKAPSGGEPEYLWSGPNYSLYHPEKPIEKK
jgi:hypothetical protein